MKPLRLAAIAVAVALAGWQLGGAAWISAKANLGQLLLERAWVRTEPGADMSRPWPWAQTGPVARLHVPELQAQALVLAGDDGATLAWGPGLVSTGDDPSGGGHTVIAAHRDTHFRFLAQIERGHEVWLERPGGGMTLWRVARTRVVDSRSTALDLHAPGPLLTLVTCFPFDAVDPGGPLRFVVTLLPVPQPTVATGHPAGTPEGPPPLP